MKKITLENYKKDKYYPKVVFAVDAILKEKNKVKTTDVFKHLGILEDGKLKEWDNGKVPYLEKVLNGSLSKLSRILRILRFHVHDLNMKPRRNIMKNGKRKLRYSKTGEPKLEEAYSLEFLVLSKSS